MKKFQHDSGISAVYWGAHEGKYVLSLIIARTYLTYFALSSLFFDPLFDTCVQKKDPSICCFMQVGHWSLASLSHPAVSQIRTGPLGAAMLHVWYLTTFGNSGKLSYQQKLMLRCLMMSWCWKKYPFGFINIILLVFNLPTYESMKLTYLCVGNMLGVGSKVHSHIICKALWAL